MSSKRCVDCKRLKCSNQFYKSSSEKDGRQRRCIACEGKRYRDRQNNLRAQTGLGRFSCTTCAGQQHRVVGPECRECGLPYRAEDAVRLDDNVMRSNAGALEVS